MQYRFKTPKECTFCIRLPAGLNYSGCAGAWDGIYTVVDYPDFRSVCKAIEKTIVKREKAHEKYMEDAYERHLEEGAEEYMSKFF